MINVTVWNEGVHEKTSNEVAGVYPAGIHGCIKNFLSTQEDIEVRTATLDDDEFEFEFLNWDGSDEE